MYSSVVRVCAIVPPYPLERGHLSLNCALFYERVTIQSLYAGPGPSGSHCLIFEHCIQGVESRCDCCAS